MLSFPLTTSLTDNVLEFWFENSDITKNLQNRRVWFRSTPEFDREIYTKFNKVHSKANKGHLDHMRYSQRSCLALIIILDQFSRNLFRNNIKAFASDSKALLIANHAIELGYDQNINDYAKLFFYLPFEHSEKLSDQKKSVELHRAINNKHIGKAADYHYRTIVRFGRFPHRNGLMNRKSTSEEITYLKNPRML